MQETTLKVLLVEDNPSHAEIVKAILRRAQLTSFQLEHARSLAEACKSLATRPSDVVLLDLGLPDAGGLEALSLITGQFPEATVVVMTSNNDPSLAVETAAAGANDYVYKGDMTAHTLERILRHAIQRQDELLQIRNANKLLDDKNIELQRINKLLDRRNEELQKARDLLGRKNRRLEQMYEMAQQFVDNVSHDFRTPLTVIKEYVSIMRDGLVGPVTPEQAKFLGIVNDRTDDLAIMVDDMLDVSRVDMGLLRIWRRHVKMNDIISHVYPILERRALTNDIHITFDVAEDLPVVYCDPDKMGRVIVNLGMNAIKFCEKGGTVRLWARHTKGSPEIVAGVTDNGPGISPDNLQRIFQRFQQVKRAGRVATKGFGLGLTIAKDLVDLNLGEIGVESQVGVGSTFSFTLPLWNVESLVKRYLERSDRVGNRTDSLSLLAATIDPSVPLPVSNAVDEFLQHAVHGDDLILRLSSWKWLAVTQCDANDAVKMIDRVHKVWVEGNQSVCERSLPEISLHIINTWSGPEKYKKILRRCSAESAAELTESAESFMTETNHGDTLARTSK